MSTWMKTGCRLLAMFLCVALLMPNFTCLVTAAEIETDLTEGTVSASTAAVFDISALDGLIYSDGVVSAWMV